MADKINRELLLSDAKITFVGYRYAPVLRRLLDEGLSLVSCPFTLTVRTSLRQRGLAVGDMEWKFLGERDVSLNITLIKIAEQQFDEEKVAILVDAK